MILGLPKMTPTDHVLRTLEWMPMRERWNCQRATFMFKVARGMVPDYVTEQFTPLSTVYESGGRSSRGSDAGNFRPPISHGRTEWGRRRCASHGVYLWNSLPGEVKAMERLGPFKRGLRDHLRDGFRFYSLN